MVFFLDGSLAADGDWSNVNCTLFSGSASQIIMKFNLTVGRCVGCGAFLPEFLKRVMRFKRENKNIYGGDTEIW